MPAASRRFAAVLPIELNKVNPFDYLTELLRHRAELTLRPAEWMPWNYRGTANSVAA
jgi:hypothetical protein